MDKQRALEKIKKCLDLSKSANEHEAANALAMAQKLMKKYQLSEVDVSLAELSEKLTEQKFARKPAQYIISLMFTIDRAFGVDSTLHGGRARFYGDSFRVDLAQYAFDVVIGLIKTKRREFLKELHGNCNQKTRNARTDSFCNGFVAAIDRNIDSMDVTPEYKESLKLYFSKFGNLSTVRAIDRTKGREDILGAFFAGYDQGQEVNLRTPVNGTETLKLR